MCCKSSEKGETITEPARECIREATLNWKVAKTKTHRVNLATVSGELSGWWIRSKSPAKTPICMNICRPGGQTKGSMTEPEGGS